MLTHTKAWMAMLVGAISATACDKMTTTDTNQAPTTPPASSAVSNTNAVVETKPDPLAGVANRAHINLDPNATAIDPPKSAILVTGTSVMVRESPRGAAIETLETTANVKEVQRDGNYYLVTYPDPKGSAKVFAGWVYRDSLVGEGWSPAVPGSPRTTGKLACGTSQSHLRTTEDFCAKACVDDRDCDGTAGEICDGLAFRVNERMNTTSDARYCISDHSPSANADHSREHGSSSNLPVTK